MGLNNHFRLIFIGVDLTLSGLSSQRQRTVVKCYLGGWTIKKYLYEKKIETNR